MRAPGGVRVSGTSVRWKNPNPRIQRRHEIMAKSQGDTPPKTNMELNEQLVGLDRCFSLEPRVYFQGSSRGSEEVKKLSTHPGLHVGCNNRGPQCVD